MKTLLTQTNIPKIIRDVTGTHRNVQKNGQWIDMFDIIIWVEFPVAQLKIKRKR